ncbi:hypothetical protein [Flavobacterium sp.]|uniref:hypothetical protein n=1 Tax=Flavobacterium sp. TaxID=239 RepID=UPI0039190890
MKHLFTIHSHITFLAAMGTIVYENIATEEVILITGSGYKPKLSAAFKGKVVKAHDSLEASYSLLDKIKNWNYTQSVHRYINQLIGTDDFRAYVDTMTVFNRYLVMHPKCQQFHIIEEGIVNYADYDDFRLWTADLRQFQWQWKGFGDSKQMLNACIRLLRGRSLRLLAMPIHPNLYTLHKGVNAYCFSDFAFQYTPKSQKQILNWNALTTYVNLEPSDYKDGSWFWIGDALCKSYGISMAHYESAMAQWVEKINPNKEARVIYVKFRGSESKEEKDLTLQYLSQYHFTIVMIPAHEIMELVFLQYKHLTVCGIASSLLIYAHLIGHATYSIYQYIPDEYGVSLNKSYSNMSKKVGFIS